MSGGFIPDSSVQPATETSTSSSSSPSRLLLSLTPRQEGRLRFHLDDRLLSLERDERKHSFGSLVNLLGRLFPLLHLILQIPPLEPWSSLRISYLLTFTGSIPTYISFLSLIPIDNSSTSPEDDKSQLEKHAARTLRGLLDFLGEVDRGWSAVLRGDGWLPSSESGGRGKPVKVDYGGSVGATERIRLRSIIIAGREKVLAWARTYGNFRGTSFPQEHTEGKHESEDIGNEPESSDEGREWEAEILGMWNGTLEMLADHDFGTDDTFA